VTCLIPSARINEKFLAALRNACKRLKARLILIPCLPNFKNDEIGWDYLEDCGIGYDEVLKSNLSLSNKLTVSSERLNINLLDPVNGMDYLVERHSSMIFGAPRHRFKAIPRSLKQMRIKLPRGMFCTGTVSEPYYKKTKGGKKAETFHQMGALLVSVKKKSGIFIPRQIQPAQDGSFYIDKTQYFPDGTIKKLRSVPSINLGDIHPGFEDKYALRAAFEMCDFFKPKNIVIHDYLDCFTISHHITSKYITQAILPMKELEAEAEMASNLINTFCLRYAKARILLVASNHPEHLERYLDEGRYVQDKINKIFALGLAQDYAIGLNPAERAMRKFNRLANARFLTRFCSVIIEGIEVANHGDKGNNGGSSSPRSLSIVHGRYFITGHTHSPEITPWGGFVNGTLTVFYLPYVDASGGTTWMHVHTLTYPGGARTHLFTIDGHWKL